MRRDATSSERSAQPLMDAPDTSPPVCASCEVVVRWRPTRAGGLPFCCPGCAAGGPCTCSYDEVLT